MINEEVTINEDKQVFLLPQLGHWHAHKWHMPGQAFVSRSWEFWGLHSLSLALSVSPDRAPGRFAVPGRRHRGPIVPCNSLQFLRRSHFPATSRLTRGPGTSTAPHPGCPGSTASRAACTPAWSRPRWPPPPPRSRAWPTTTPRRRRSPTSPPPPLSRQYEKRWPSWPRSRQICLSSRSNISSVHSVCILWPGVAETATPLIFSYRLPVNCAKAMAF